MQLNLHKMYQPVTAAPFSTDGTYVEMEPCEALKPYIRCFWGTTETNRKRKETGMRSSLIIPDTCMDIILDIDNGSQTASSLFCGINDRFFYTSSDNGRAGTSTFAIRFHFWAIPLVTAGSMEEVQNIFCDVEHYFPDFKKELEERLSACSTMKERIHLTEDYLLKRINQNRANETILNGIHHILQYKGKTSVSSISAHTCISKRQLERLFKEYIGTTPKKLSNLVRYQYLWREIALNPHFNVQDAVLAYGFSDQAHLINSFKQFHSLTPKEAVAFARQ